MRNFYLVNITIKIKKTGKHGGDAVLRNNKLRDILVESFHRAHIHVQFEAGSGLS